MKNKIVIVRVFIHFFFIFFLNKALAEDLIFNAREINTSDNENIIKAINGVNIIDTNGLIINGDTAEYNKKKSILKVTGNVIAVDKNNKIILKAKEITYFRSLNIIRTKKFTTIEINKKHTIETSNLLYDGNLKFVSSKNSTRIKDLYNNRVDVSEFIYSITTKVLSAENGVLLDNESNRYNIQKLKLDLLQDKIIGKDIVVNFNNKLFNSLDNQPRLRGNAIFLSKGSTIIKKGVFTTCKKTDDCPPWEISSDKITHDKTKKIIHYDKAWLKVYDVPILYFPKFFHPDPTVKRQSGFLIPAYNESKTHGGHISMPYFKVIRDNIDLTFSPRFYTNDKTLLQTEYRHLTKNSNHILDFSIKNSNPVKLNSKESQSETHFFSNSSFKLNFDYFDLSKVDLKIQQTSNDSYLKKYKLKSDLIESTSDLHSKINFEATKDSSELNIIAEVFEDLSKNKSDRYEYILPSYSYSKNIYEDLFNGNLIFSSLGYNRIYNTNVNKKVAVNDFNYKSNYITNSAGFISNYEILFKNFNSDSKNSNDYKNKIESNIQSLINYEIKYPLKKSGKKFNSILSPIISARYSPNQNKNLSESDRLIDYNNIFSINRIGSDENVEGGQSITIGNEYKIYEKENDQKEIFSLNLATMFRDEEDTKLPESSTLGKEKSDIIGGMKFKTNQFIDLSYNFSLDSDLDTVNYNSINTTFSVNNFVTSFEFLEKNNILGSESYFSNNTTLDIDSNNSLIFKTRENKEKDLIEYYNLIYQYKNDCLIAGVEYKKDYYKDVGIEPEEQLMFSITIMPFAKINKMSDK